VAGMSAPASRIVLGRGLRAVITALLCLLVTANLLPLLWGILTSFKPDADLLRFPPVFLDFTPTLDHYERVIVSGFLGSMAANALYAAITVVATLSLALPAAYAFDRFEFPFRQSLFMLVVACIPLSLGAAALLIPNYVYFVYLGLTNTWFVLPMIYTAHQLPMAIWIVKGVVESIPRELDEAVIVDGGGHGQILRFVMLPLARPALGAAGVLAFVGSWNEFVAGSVMVDAPELKPVQPMIYSFIGFFGREWGPLTAAATLGIVPILIAFGILGRHIVSGLTKGAVKG